MRPASQPPHPSDVRRDGNKLRLSTTIFGLTLVMLLGASCGTSTPTAAPGTARTGRAESGPSNAYAVPAVREQLTTNSRSPVVHDNEIMALAPQGGRLFAATDQWEYSGPSAYGQILVKNSATSPWKIFEQTQSTRVQALDSFPIPSDQGLGAGHSLLITQAIVNGQSEIQWLLDGATSFAPDDAFILSSPNAAVRSFGAHESDGVWAIYAGVGPTGILQGTWSPTKHTLVFNPEPELSGASPGCARPEDPEGHGVRRLRRRALRHHQHQDVPSQRRLASRTGSPLDARRSRATGGPVQQRIARDLVHHPRRITVPALLDAKAAVTSTASTTCPLDSCPAPQP